MVWNAYLMSVTVVGSLDVGVVGVDGVCHDVLRASWWRTRQSQSHTRGWIERRNGFQLHHRITEHNINTTPPINDRIQCKEFNSNTERHQPLQNLQYYNINLS